MELSEDLLTVFTAEIESRNGQSAISVPERELSIGSLEAGEAYRIAVYPQPGVAGGEESVGGSEVRQGDDEPPVEEGATLDVEIEDVGDQGDGIARIGPGYIVFVPDTEVGDRVTIEITQARENFAFAEVVEPEPVAD